MSTNSLIPLNRVRKSSRALIESVWQAGNRRPDFGLDAEEIPATPPDFPDRRAEIARKIERIAARRVRQRALQI